MEIKTPTSARVNHYDAVRAVQRAGVDPDCELWIEERIIENTALKAQLAEAKELAEASAELLAELAEAHAVIERQRAALEKLSVLADEQRRMFCCCNQGTGEVTEIMRGFIEIAQRGLGGDNA